MEIKAAGKVAWCACKHSQKAPFCDGTHSKIGFQAAEEDARAVATNPHDFSLALATAAAGSRMDG